MYSISSITRTSPPLSGPAGHSALPRALARLPARTTRGICSFHCGSRFSSTGTLACAFFLRSSLESGISCVRLTKPHSQEWLCYLCRIAAFCWSHDARNHHSCSRCEDVDGTLEDEFQKTPCNGQFRIDGIAIAKTFRADHEETGAIFDLQAANGAVRLWLGSILLGENRRQPGGGIAP